MKNHGGKASTFADIFRRNAARIAGLAIAFGLVGLPALGLAQDAPTSVATAYRDLPQLGGSRNLIWVIAQLHLLLAGFVLGCRSLRGSAKSSAGKRVRNATTSWRRSSPSC